MNIPVPYTFADIERQFVTKASAYVARRYHPYGVTFDDAQQEIYAYLYSNRKQIEKWLAASPQRTTRIYRSMLDVGISLGETEKAARCGYDTSDVAWYSPTMVEGLMPLALDDTYDGIPAVGDDKVRSGKPANEGGDLTTMILDIRRALKRCPEWVESTFRHDEAGVPGWDDAVQAVINYLGGSRPQVGRRRVMTNAAAQYITRDQEAS